MKDKIANFIAYALISFVVILCLIYGVERIKKLGYKILKKYGDNPYEIQKPM
jgi:hypothetical protein